MKWINNFNKINNYIIYLYYIMPKLKEVNESNKKNNLNKSKNLCIIKNPILKKDKIEIFIYNDKKKIMNIINNI